jgi:hypothetical protein
MYPASLVITDNAALWLQRTTSGKQLAVIATSDHPWLAQFSGEAQSFSDGYVLKLCPAKWVHSR